MDYDARKMTADKLRRMAAEVDDFNRTAQRLGEITAALEKRKKMRRFTWYRDHNAVADDVRWSLVARITGAPLHLVEAFQRRLDLFANCNEPRGSVESFSVPALAARWGTDDELLARIYAAMETTEVGWIDDGFLVTFWERNPDVEDNTAAERMRRMRAKRKAARAEGAYPQSDSVTRNNRNVTTRAEQNFSIREVDNSGDNASGGAAGLSEGQGSTPDPQLEAAVWLAGEGARIVAERLQETPARAATRIERWRTQALDGDAKALVDVIRAADATDYIGPRFHNLVVDGIKRVPRQGPVQAELKLPPVSLNSRREAG